MLAVLAASGWGCNKQPTGDAVAVAEAGADAWRAGAALDDSGAGEASAATAADASAPDASTATAPRAPGGPFEGTYQCLDGLTLKQNGNLVSGVIVNKLTTSTQTTQWNCSVVRPDHCEGMETVTVRFNDPKTTPKLPSSRKLSIDRQKDGVAIKLERSAETTFCKK